MESGPTLTKHAQEMATERGISLDWIRATLTEPDQIDRRADGTAHFLRVISDFGGRTLRIVLNTKSDRVITVFFDRRMGRRK
jgi:hypothetical protein